jgi:UPF0755 protein
MRKRKYQVARISAIAFIALVLVLYVGYRFGLQPVSTNAQTKIFTVLSGQDAQVIATNLKAQDLIRDRTSFITYVNLHGMRPDLKVGQYALAPDMSAQTIAGIIADGKTVAKNLVIPEGYRLTQIESAAAAVGIAPAAFTAALAAPHTNSFLATKPAGVSLEGYLFPDSYQVSPSTTALELVDEMLTDFGNRVGPAYTQAFTAEGLSLHQGVTIASIVQAEVSNPADQPIVAQIFIKRLQVGMPLGSDETAQYAADLDGVPFSTSINSPYNTLLVKGLPPGPICSPGLAALDAVAHPATTDYLYFLTGKDGKNYYATTYAQHEENIAKYLN